VIKEIVIVTLYVLIAFTPYLMWRNFKVHRYLLDLLDKVSALAKEDIEQGRPWEWRYKALNQLSYNQMVIQFWRPLHTFVTDRKFLEPVK
jgi:hypothetical protein